MGSRLRVVVADDEVDTREYFQYLMERLGHDVRAAEDGRRLVEVCREFEPDLIVTDYAMPGLNGLAAASEASRGRPAPVPVILISGRQDVELSAKGAGVCLVTILTKPVKETDLREAVEAAGARQAAR